MTCRNIKHYKGTKTQIIMKMINDNKRAEIVKNLPKLQKDKQVLLLVNKIKIINEKYDEVKDKHKIAIDKVEKKLTAFGLNYSRWGDGKVEVGYGCHVPDIDSEKLEKADHLFSLGKRKEAILIWDKMIEKYNLC